MSFRLSAEDIKIGILTVYKLNSVVITPISGKYSIYSSGEKIIDVKINTSIHLTILDNCIIVSTDEKNYGAYNSIDFVSSGFLNYFTINSTKYAKKEFSFDDDLNITVVNNCFKFINIVDLEHYIAGVVEAEGGRKASSEYYKVQAIICRTYAICHLNKHKSEGYEMCDLVHCQVYNGKCRNTDILMAASETSGMVIVDERSKPINATYHSNCGGQTINSIDVWSINRSYLKPIVDKYCTSQPNARWERHCLKKAWLAYLGDKFNYPINDSGACNAALNFKQWTRKTYFLNDKDIPLSKIRNDWLFKSSYFSIYTKGDSVVFKGRGYGHGVGLCQEGAMKMAEEGIKFRDIIKTYYHNVKIVNYEEIK
ncbi:MAG: SpoIID/LytB domain-containing protein [Bacteroidota bacterium]|nr:SpoIID/LytB domain-containing protein [Bacteroidota bacterium]